MLKYILISRIGSGCSYFKNLCPACMRKILDNTHLIDENTDAWGSI